MTKLKEIREDLGLTTVQLAARARISPVTLWRMEKGLHVRRRSRGQVAQALGIPVKELFPEPADADGKKISVGS